MISLLLNRVYRSIKIDPEVFDEVQKDKNATLSAAIVVLLSSSATGIGAAHLGMVSFFLAPILSLVSWFAWAYIVYLVGVKLFPDLKTRTTQVALLRAIGFSSAPGIIRIFSFNADLMFVTFIGSSFWMLACMVVAVRQTLNYKSLLKALGVVIIAWFIQVFVLISILAVTRNF
tara:strand:- start:70 stop:591 length:522 start_codon:yes stop_codon:yes gene_type:complete